MKKLKFLFLVVIGCLMLISTGEAAIFIEQGKVELELVGGETATGTVNINNTTQDPITIKIYWEDFEYLPPFDGAKKFYPPQTLETSCAAWIQFSPQSLTLQPFQKAEISYVINPPKDIEGGYYGVLFFEKAQMQKDLKTGLSLRTRVGSLFFLESTKKSKDVFLEEIEVFSGKFISIFVNKGNVIIIPSGIYYVMDAEGLVVDRGDIDKVYLPSGKKADYQFSFNNQLGVGEYTIVLTIDLGEEDVLVQEVDFEKRTDGLITISDIR